MRKVFLLGVLFLGGCTGLPWVINEKRIDNNKQRISALEKEVKDISPKFEPPETKDPREETGSGGLGLISRAWAAIPIPEPYKTGGTTALTLLAILLGRKKKREDVA